MAYTDSAARRLEFYEHGAAAPQTQTRPSFEVVEGAGLDARVRQGVSAEFIAHAKRVALIAAVVAVVCMARIALWSAAVAQLSANQDLRSEVSTAAQLERDLKITTSSLSSASRIESIATQTYGMKRAETYEVMTLGATGATTMDSAITDTDTTADTDDVSKGTTTKKSSSAASSSVQDRRSTTTTSALAQAHGDAGEATAPSATASR